MSRSGQRFFVVPGAFKDMDKVPDDAKDNPLIEAALDYRGTVPGVGPAVRLAPPM